MKKITLALCACAFALTGLFVSCSSGTTDYINYTNSSATYHYAVKGTMSSTDERTSVDASNKVSKTVRSYTSEIANGNIWVSWSENETRESNYDVYSISGSTYGTTKSVSKEYYDNALLTGGEEETSTDSAEFGLEIFDIDGTYYVDINGEKVKLESLAASEDEDAFDGKFGKEFSLNFKFTNDKFQKNNYTEANNTYATSKQTRVRTTEYKLTFTPVEDFDPNAEDD